MATTWADWHDIDEDERRRRRAIGSVPPPPLRLFNAAEFVQGFEPPDYIVDDILQRGYLYTLTGRTGDGKTSIATHLAIMMAAEMQFAGRHIEKANVIFLAGENAQDMRARFIMACEAHGLEPAKLPVYFIDQVFDIGHGLETVKGHVEAVGGAGLVVVDTMAAFLQGKAGANEENDNTDMGKFTREMRSLTLLPGKPCVVACAHPTKHAKSKSELLPRGGGACIAEVDGNLTAWSDNKGETTELHWTGKLRGPGFEPIMFRNEKRTSDLVKDRKGRGMQSVVTRPMTDDDLKQAQASTLSEQDRLLDDLLQWPSSSIAERCNRLGWIGATRKPQKSKADDRFKDLLNDKLTKRGRAGRWELTNQGRKEAERINNL